jgi:hypothetical protein
MCFQSRRKFTSKDITTGSYGRIEFRFGPAIFGETVVTKSMPTFLARVATRGGCVFSYQRMAMHIVAALAGECSYLIPNRWNYQDPCP